MPYIGARPVIEFSTIPSKDSFTGDGSTVAFDLGNDISTGGENALEVFVNNVRQEPGSGKAFTLGPDASLRTRRITFTAAPANGASIYVINDKTNSMTLLNPKDLNGVELILDSDADTSLTADTDDRIDFKIAGTDHFHITTSSGDTLIKQMTDAKDIIFQQYDGNKILEINDANYVAISGAAAGPGELRFYEDTDLGTNYTGFKAGNVTASISYVLPLADGSAEQLLQTDGSGTLSWSSTNKRPIVTSLNSAGAATITLTRAQSGSLFLINGVADNIVNMPALSTANVGVYYEFVVLTAVGGSVTTTFVLPGSAVSNFYGYIDLVAGAAANTASDVAGDTLTLVASTTINARVKLQCVSDDGTNSTWLATVTSTPIATIA